MSGDVATRSHWFCRDVITRYLEFPNLTPYVARVRKGMSMARTNPVQFIQQVRSEVSKVVWPTRREVVLTTVMVLVMATVLAIFFSLVDFGIRTALESVLTGFGS